MQRSVIKATFLAAAIISMSGWLWLLAVGIRWLIDKLQIGVDLSNTKPFSPNKKREQNYARRQATITPKKTA
jgi:hypothetical protein